jgi:hypothetical protein
LGSPRTKADPSPQRQPLLLRQDSHDGGCAVDELPGIEGAIVEFDLSSLDFGKVQYVVDDGQESGSGALEALQRAPLLGREACIVEQQLGISENPVQRRANLVAHRGKEVGLGRVRLVRGGFRRLQFLALPVALADVPDRAQDDRLA